MRWKTILITITALLFSTTNSNAVYVFRIKSSSDLSGVTGAAPAPEDPPLPVVTLDPGRKHIGVTLSGNDLVATKNINTPTFSSCVYATHGKTEGRHMFEVTIVVPRTNYYFIVGLSDMTKRTLDVNIGSTTKTIGYTSQYFYYPGSSSPTLTPTFGTSTTRQTVAVDMDAKTVDFYVNDEHIKTTAGGSVYAANFTSKGINEAVPMICMIQTGGYGSISFDPTAAGAPQEYIDNGYKPWGSAP